MARAVRSFTNRPDTWQTLTGSKLSKTVLTRLEPVLTQPRFPGGGGTPQGITVVDPASWGCACQNRVRAGVVELVAVSR
jgi:hypothetical protein